MSISLARSARRPLVAGIGLSLAAASLSLATAAPAQAADPVEVNILGINDFHGRINDNGAEAGAAVLAGAVKQIRSEHPNTVFAAAGDLVGASTFESFIQKDKPTIDALNAAGLDVSAVGNHEFDAGYDDLVNRIMAPESPTNPDGGAEWEYIGANVKVKETSDAPELEPSWVQTFNPGAADEVKVGFVGAVTEELPSLVSPAGIADIQVTDIVDAVNAEADELKAEENLDLVVMLVHEGAPATDCATMDDRGVFAQIINGVNDNVDAIVSGHTHLAYDCKFPVAGWADRAVKQRPVVSAGQYGMNLNQLTFQVDPDTGEATQLTTAILPLVDVTQDAEGEDVFTPKYPADSTVAGIVSDANAEAEVRGAEELGKLAGPFDRARRTVPDGDDEGTEPDVVDSRGGESTLGNLVAEAQRWATEPENLGGADVAFMNPGGLRADMRPGEGGVLTYKGAAVVQPFANTLVNMDMTGAQIKQLLEEQWQPASASRPFLRLGISKGFEYAYDPAAPAGKRILGMWLDGNAVGNKTVLSVTANSFLANGGDNFAAFTKATNKKDSGQIDLAAMVDYMAEHARGATPLAVDYSQRSVGVHTTSQAVTLSSLAMTGPDDVRDDQVEVFLGDRSLGKFDVEYVPSDSEFDEAGTVTLPNNLAKGRSFVLRVKGDKTGTDIRVPVGTSSPAGVTRIKTNVRPKRVFAKRTRPRVIAVVRTDGKPAKGRVRVVHAGKKQSVKLNRNGRAVVKMKRFPKAGKKKVRVIYASGGKRTVKVVTIRVRPRR